ncbi:MAG: RNA 2'-phosphotransferase [Deltaproteobacteria bacterium]|nr:RNA 2'-phosphotransferase [Deltaproteobacteria bacterium]
MGKRSRIKQENLGRLMVYILGYRPDEFGLVPDREGYVSYKELLWALHEEEGMGYVQRGHLNEVLMGKGRDLFETQENRIRSTERHWTFERGPLQGILPKILYTAVRGRAYPVVLKEGLRSPRDGFIVLAMEREMALRIGRRRDQSPVVVEVKARDAEKEHVLFHSFGRLYLSKMIPSHLIAGPRLPDEKEKVRRPVEDKKKKPIDFGAGTFLLEVDRRDKRRDGLRRGKKKKGWKEEVRKKRRR